MRKLMGCLLLLLLTGCGTNFNDVQIAKIHYDAYRINALRSIEVSKIESKAARQAVEKATDPKYENAGFVVETTATGQISGIYIGKDVMNGGNSKPREVDYASVLAHTDGYAPKESYIGKEILTTVRDVGLYVLGYKTVENILDNVGARVTTNTTAGRDAVTSTGAGNVNYNPVADAYKDQSNNSVHDNPVDNSNQGNPVDQSNQGNPVDNSNQGNPVDNSNQGNPVDNSDNRTNYDNPVDAVTVPPVVVNQPVVVPPVNQPVVVPPVIITNPTTPIQ